VVETTRVARRGEAASHQRIQRTPDSKSRTLPIDIRTLRVGMQLTLVAPAAASAGLVVATRTQIEMGPYAGIFAAIAVVTTLATLLPWERLLRSRAGMPLLAAWSVLALGMVTVGVWATGGDESPLVLLYALTTVFFAVAFPPKGQIALLVLTLGGYWLAIAPVTVGPTPMIALCVLSFLSGFLVHQIRRRVLSESEARGESDRRWALLATVSAAAREMTGSDIDPDEVLASVIGAVSGLGFERTTIYVRDGGRFRKVHGPLSDRPVPALITRVVDEANVIRFDASTQSAHDLPAVGVAVPIFVSDGVAAVLVVGSAHGHRPTSEDVEVFRMLASQASLALANVRRFEEQQQVIDRLEGLDRMKRDWLSTVSHELRTPLTVINGMGRMLEDQWTTLDEDTRVDFLARINANAATLDRVIAQLLDFSRLDSGQLRPETTQIDLSSLLTTVVDRLRTLFREHDLEIDVEPGLFAVADPGLIERIIENLLSNAAKYTPAGTRVTVGAHPEDDDVVVLVSDEGPGIPANELARIGERFFRGGDVMTRTTRGTGLGLAVVSEILQQHDSHLEVQSEVGIGSVFSFRLSATSLGAPPVTPTIAPEPGLKAVGTLPIGTPERFLHGDRFETILTAAQMGVEWALGVLYRTYHPRLVCYVRARGADEPQAMASGVWRETVKSLPAFSGGESAFRCALFGAAYARLSDAASTEIDLQVIEASVSGTGEVVDRFTSLSSDEADVILLRALGNLDADDVALVMGRDPGSVRLLELHALRRLEEPTAVAAGAGS
jgi:signal transduction histidine kinase/DNA-directed RNA polymerase specialized sigma24 family protein